MKKLWKRIFPMILSLSMIISLTGVPVYANTPDLPNNPAGPISSKGTFPVAINETNFPDAVFRQYVSDEFDKDKDNSLSEEEIAAVNEIDVHYKGISSLKGIEYFTALTELTCSCNNLTSLDVRNNTDLTFLNFYSNKIANIDVSNNMYLKNLNCSYNNLTNLNVSNNKNLVSLDCASNNLTTIDVSNNKNLNSLLCNNNQLTTLNVSNNTVLRYLYFYGNNITSIDLSKNVALTNIRCNNNQLTSLDLSKNTALTSVECIYNSYDITAGADGKFDLSALPGNFDATKASNWNGNGVSYSNGILTFTQTESEQIVPVTYDYNCGYSSPITFTLNATVPAKINLGIEINEINFPDATFRGYVTSNFDKDNNGYLSDSEIAAATKIDVSGMGIYDLKGIEHFTALTSLVCYENNLTSLDVSSNTDLFTLYCDDNNLSSLDISSNTKLYSVYCGNNKLTSLIVGNNTRLEGLSCDGNNLETIDLSGLPNLEEFDISNNNLTSIDLSNNSSLIDRKFIYDGNIYDIIIEDDGTFDLTTLPGNFDVTKASNWIGGTVSGNTLTVDESVTSVTYDYDSQNSNIGKVTFTLNVTNPLAPSGIEINETNFPDAIFRGYVTSNFDTNKNGYLSNSEIANATTIRFSYSIVSNFKGIEYLTALEKFEGYFLNNLTELDVSNNTELTYLDCSGNNLTEIDVSNNTKLTELYCSSNNLTEIDVSKNTELTYLDCPYNYLTEIDVSKNTKLTELYCYSNSLTSLDVSKNTELTYLDCYSNNLDTLDVSNNTNLTDLYCYSNNLTSLDLSNNTNLTDLIANDNSYDITIKADGTFDLSSLPTGFDVSKASNWNGGTVSGNILTVNEGVNTVTYDYDSQNSVSGKISFKLNVTNSPATSGIEINEINFPDATFRNYVKSNFDTNKDGYLSKNEIAAVTTINVNNKGILSLKGIEYFTALTELDCSNNNLTSLDVSANTSLTKLYCTGNRFNIKVTSNGKFNLSTLPTGFDLSKASNWNGGTVSGNILTVYYGVNYVTYNYDYGNNITVSFTLNVTWENNGYYPPFYPPFYPNYPDNSENDDNDAENVVTENPVNPDDTQNPDTTVPEEKVELPFIDVDKNDWFYEAVEYVYENEIMNGVSDNTFGSNDNVTRAMVWTVLARISGADVNGGDPWYAKSQAWAIESGVSDGTDPEFDITREQIVTMLYRFAGSPKVSGTIAGYPDGTDVSEWAYDAMVWAVNEGLIKGDDYGKINPLKNATRAELSVMLMRFDDILEKYSK